MSNWGIFLIIGLLAVFIFVVLWKQWEDNQKAQEEEDKEAWEEHVKRTEPNAEKPYYHDEWSKSFDINNIHKQH